MSQTQPAIQKVVVLAAEVLPQLREHPVG